MTSRAALAALAAAALWAPLAVAAVPTTAPRQSVDLVLPRESPAASLSQRIGVTDVAVWYHRPAVKGRTIWGELVPYGQVWRTGANENTLLSFSTAVTVEGQPLAAGTYGLHTLPGETEWEVIFSHDTTAWGSFSYDAARDALRVKVKPEAAAHEERLSFAFDEVTEGGATLALRWERLRLPIHLAADSPALTLESIHDQLRGVARFSWIGFNQAAQWSLQKEIAYEEALGWADRSIEVEERFENLSAKAELLARTGKAAEGEATMARALSLANAGQLHQHGRQLLGQGKKEEALEIFRTNGERHPEAWFIGVGLARGYAALGRFAEASQALRGAIERAPADQKDYLRGLLGRLDKGEDIN